MFRMSALRFSLLVITCVGLVGIALGQACQCCWYVFAWADGEGDEDGVPCNVGYMTECKTGTVLTSSGRCADGVHLRNCYKYYAESSMNVILHECLPGPPGFRRIGPAHDVGPHPQCCFVDEETYANREVLTQHGSAGVVNCEGDC